MKVYINDIEKDFNNYAAPTLSSLLEQEGIESRGAAIAINNKIVRKPLWDKTILKDGDRISVVRIAFGG